MRRRRSRALSSQIRWFYHFYGMDLRAPALLVLCAAACVPDGESRFERNIPGQVQRDGGGEDAAPRDGGPNAVRDGGPNAVRDAGPAGGIDAGFRDAGRRPPRDGGPRPDLGPADPGPFGLIREDPGIPGMYLGGIGVEDFDEDGDNDVVMFGFWDAGHSDGINCSGSMEGRYYENVSTMGGPTSFVLAHTWPNQGVCEASVVTGDVNGDGHRDFVVQISVERDTLAYFGDGNGNFTTAALEPGFGVHSNSIGMAIADIDQDGTDDIVFNSDGYADSFGGAGSGLWYRWNGAGFAKMQTGFPHQIVYGGTIAAGDLDGDGYPEIAIGGNAAVPFGDYFCGNELYGQIHKNNGGTFGRDYWTVIPNYSLRNYGRDDINTPPDPNRIGDFCNGGDNLQYWIGDLDNDGFNDIVSAGSGGFSGRVGPQYPGSTHYSVAILRNVTGTGLDYVTWENVHIGAGGLPGNLGGDFTNSGVGNVDLPSIAVGDLNGDGWPEVVVQGHRRWLEDRFAEYIFQNFLFRNLGNGDFEWVTDAIPMPNPIAECGNVIADLNRDGKDDLIVCGAERPWHSNGANPGDFNDASSIKTYVFRQP